MYEIMVRNLSRNKFLSYFFVTFFVIVLSHLLTRNITETCAGVVTLAISLIPLVQVVSKMIELEEIKVEKEDGKLLNRHEDFIVSYFGIFFGAVFGYYLSFLLFPKVMFTHQINAINEIHSELYGVGKVLDKEAMFSYILINNLKVLLLSVIMSFLFGAGAIYVILWNASIVGVFIGLKSSEFQGNILIKYVFYPIYSLVKLLPHGILEFLSYFLAALSGGLISLAIIKGNFKKIEKIVVDSVLYLVLSIIILVVAAFIEAFL